MRVIILFSCVLASFAPLVYAIEKVAIFTTPEKNITIDDATLKAILACNAEFKFYSPKAAGADAKGCVKPCTTVTIPNGTTP